MRREPQETSITESSSNPIYKTISSNPYEQADHVDNTNVNQQWQTIDKKDPEEPPPSYFTVIQSSSNPIRTHQQKTQSENIIQNSSLNDQISPEISFSHNHKWRRHSTNVICSNCGATVHTRVETSITIITILVAVLLFCFCCCLAVIPFCVPSFKKTTHYCSNCNSVLGEIHEFQ